MSKQYALTGIADILEFKKGGVKLKNSGDTEMQVRNNADAAFLNMGGLDATLSYHFITLSQAQALANGLFWIDPVQVVEEVGDLALTGEQTIDGVLTSTSRVLLTVQTDPIENGVWVTAAGAWARPADFDTGDKAANKTMMVSEGSAGLADSQWTCTTNSPSDIIGTNALAFTKIASTIAGVSSLADGASITGQSLINSGGPTGAITLKSVLGGQSITTTTNGTGDIVASVDALGIGTAQLADAAVTLAKIAPFATTAVTAVAFVFGDAASAVQSALAMPANSVVQKTWVKMDVAFDVIVEVQLGIAGTPSLYMGSAEIDEGNVDNYVGEMSEGAGAGAKLEVTLGAGAPTVGSGTAYASYFVTA